MKKPKEIKFVNRDGELIMMLKDEKKSLTKTQEKSKIQQYKDFPYCFVGHSTLLPEFSITMRAKGLKGILDKTKHDEDLIKITIFHDNRATKVEICKRGE